MNSGSFISTKVSSNTFWLQIDWNQVKNSSQENSSTINYSLYLKSTYNNGYTRVKNVYLTIDGTEIKLAPDGSQYTCTNKSVKIDEGSFTVYHNDDGSKDLTFELRGQMWSSNAYVNVTGSQEVTLDTIDRYFVITVEDRVENQAGSLLGSTSASFLYGSQVTASDIAISAYIGHTYKAETSTTVTANTTLYRFFTLNTYTVTIKHLYLDNEIYTPDIITASYGSSVNSNNYVKGISGFSLSSTESAIITTNTTLSNRYTSNGPSISINKVERGTYNDAVFILNNQGTYARVTFLYSYTSVKSNTAVITCNQEIVKQPIISSSPNYQRVSGETSMVVGGSFSVSSQYSIQVVFTDSATTSASSTGILPTQSMPLSLWDDNNGQVGVVIGRQAELSDANKFVSDLDMDSYGWNRNIGMTSVTPYNKQGYFKMASIDIGHEPYSDNCSIIKVTRGYGQAWVSGEFEIILRNDDSGKLSLYEIRCISCINLFPFNQIKLYVDESNNIAELWYYSTNIYQIMFVEFLQHYNINEIAPSGQWQINNPAIQAIPTLNKVIEPVDNTHAKYDGNNELIDTTYIKADGTNSSKPGTIKQLSNLDNDSLEITDDNYCLITNENKSTYLGRKFTSIYNWILSKIRVCSEVLWSGSLTTNSTITVNTKAHTLIILEGLIGGSSYKTLAIPTVLLSTTARIYALTTETNYVTLNVSLSGTTLTIARTGGTSGKGINRIVGML